VFPPEYPAQATARPNPDTLFPPPYQAPPVPFADRPEIRTPAQGGAPLSQAEIDRIKAGMAVPAAAQTAAAGAATAGGSPEQVYQTALTAAEMAADTQTLAQQSPWTRRVFQSEYGANADAVWRQQHLTELARNKALYGAPEPTAGAASRVAGVGPAPNRTIGAVPAPGPGETARYGSIPRPISGGPPLTSTGSAAGAPAARVATPAAGGAATAAGTVPPLGARAAVPGAAVPAVGAPGDTRTAPSIWTPVPGQGPPRAPGAVGLPTATPSRNPADIVVATDTTGKLQAFTGREWDNLDPDMRSGRFDNIQRIPAAAPATAQRGGPSSALLDEEPVSTVDSAVLSPRPLDALAALAIHQKGEVAEPEAVRADAYNIAHGINALLSGNKAGDWAEPYLNDTARLAWARQEQQAGRVSDPRAAPVDYIEKWKDAFYGRDNEVPLVREINQQMIDYAATRTPPGKPFQWQDAYGPTGEKGLIQPQVTGYDCGPTAFSTIMRSRGYNTDSWDTFDFAIQNGYHMSQKLGPHSYTDAGFTGPANMVRMLNKEAGLDASMTGIAPDGKGWDQIDQELAAGRPVILSGPDHYWAISAKDPTTGKYYAGATALKGTPAWMPREMFRYTHGAADTAIFARGDVNPQSHAVTSMNLQPPPMTGTGDTRAYLSAQTREAVANGSGGRLLSTSGQSGNARPAVTEEPADPRIAAANNEDLWAPSESAQANRAALMREFQAKSGQERDAIFDQSMDRGLAEEGIGGAEAQRWKQAMRMIVTGEGLNPGRHGENGDLNPYIIAGESGGRFRGGADQLSSSALGYFQFLRSQPYGRGLTSHARYLPDEYKNNPFSPVGQVRQFIRSIRDPNSSHRGDPMSVVAEKNRKGTWGPE
jgi:hypothetical protein